MAYGTWNQKFTGSGRGIYCSFENLLTVNAAKTVGNNIKKILGVTYFKVDDMVGEGETHSSYKFICSRRDANKIRDQLWRMTTDTYTYVWFSIQDNPLDSLHESVPAKVKEYSMSCYFGSMYSYNTFIIHSEPYPPTQELCVIRLKNEPDTIRIVARDKSKQMFIPIKWLQNKLLVRLKNPPCVVLMLKHSVIMKRANSNSGLRVYERSCEMVDNEFEGIVSKSSDIILSFFDAEQTWSFLEELTRSNKERRTKFNIKFVTLREELAKNDKQPFHLPLSTSMKKQYAFNILDSMGYVFQDKYSKELHEKFISLDDDVIDYMCNSLKDRLEEDHCYDLNNIFNDDFISNFSERHDPKQKMYSTGSVVLTPLRLRFLKRELTIGNRALRMLQSHDEDIFLLVRIREEDNEELRNFDSSVRQRIKSKMLHGIKVMGKTYCFVGASNSQLREMSFWFMDTNNQSIEDIWKIFGNFSTIKNVATFIARIGLYFTKSIETQITFQKQEKFSSDMQYIVTMIADIQTTDEKYCFTDGIGKMSWGIAGLIATKLNLKLKYREDIPSAYQVRIAGCKGMLAIDSESTLNDYYIQIRPSMKKFDSDNWHLEVCEYSQPLPLKLNNQVIMLLSDLGNSDAVFQSYQDRALPPYWTIENEYDQRRKLEYSKNEDDLLKNKIPLPTYEGRNMFGVVDETGTLKYGQVFIQFKSLDLANDAVYNIVTGEVLVAKMPCLYPGDFRKLTAVHVPKLQSCMRDCIVFPSKGPRPHPSEMSGSDLDGDKYWVYWGKELKINEMDEPLSYESAEKKIVEKVTSEVVVDHIVKSFGTGAQGIICDVHLAIADQLPEHTRSASCKRLAELFARAVDAPKTGEIIDLDEVYELKAKYCQQYPPFMMKYDQEPRVSKSILNNLFEKALKHLNAPPENRQTKRFINKSNNQLIRRHEHDEEFRVWLKLHGPHQSDSSESSDARSNLPPGVGETVAGGNGEGDGLNQLINAEGIFIDDENETMFISDTHNSRILKWKIGDANGKVVAGGNGRGAGLNQLGNPTGVLVDNVTNSLIIAEWGNKRVVRWSLLEETKEGEILLNNIACSGLAMDDQRNLYISDTTKKEVKQYRMEDKEITLVAGCTSAGAGLDQFKWPTFIVVDEQQTIYVSDSSNNRIMKWEKGALQGKVVAGGCGKGKALNQLSYPQGIVVDKSGGVYVADEYNNRVMFWAKDATEGVRVAGRSQYGNAADQLRKPRGLALDRNGFLYVVDSANQRVQRFFVDQRNSLA